MKNFIKIIISIFLGVLVISPFITNAGVVDIPNAKDITNVSITYNNAGNIVDNINTTGFSLLKTVKLILQGVLIIFIVYIGIMMIISMGVDEEQLGKAKRQIWYSVVALIFINIPGTLFEMLYNDGSRSIGGKVSGTSWTSDNNDSNIFVDFFTFGQTFGDNIIGFAKIMIFALAIFMLVLAGIKVMTSRGREEKISEAKNKIVYVILALLFLGIIEAWKNLAFGGKISDGVNLAESIANIALFFAGPVAIFFLTLAGYYYIIANGDEEKVKKAKNIVINTILATLILLASYTFLLDLITL